jgi:hypothetical protein
MPSARPSNHRQIDNPPTNQQTNQPPSPFLPAHGFNQFFLQGRWVGAAATFDRGLCEKIGVPVVEFDGTRDALLPGRALDGGTYIEYLEHYDPVADLPLEWIVERTPKIWGVDKRAWITPKD